MSQILGVTYRVVKGTSNIQVDQLKQIEKQKDNKNHHLIQENQHNRESRSRVDHNQRQNLSKRVKFHAYIHLS